MAVLEKNNLFDMEIRRQMLHHFAPFELVKKKSIWMRIFARIPPFTDKGSNRLHPSEAKDSHSKNFLAPQLPCCLGPIWSPCALILALKGHSCPKITQHFRFVAYALFQPDPISYHQPLSRTH